MKRATVRRWSAFGKPWHFNPRPREEGDHIKNDVLQIINDFNPRPREEGDYGRGSTYSPPTYFNPRPREEGDFFAIDRERRSYISIHALVKRATAGYGRLGKSKIISIHALVKRATAKQSIRQFCIRYFNPRPREEGDYVGGRCPLEPIISIHALVKRATNVYAKNGRRYKDFNPRPREEGDSAKHSEKKAKPHFNPRPREEGDGNFLSLSL